MNTVEELAEYVKSKSTEYWNETVSNEDEKIDTMPSSIVDFTIEFFLNQSRFPVSYTEDKKIKRIADYKNQIAMACVDVYARAGAEGQTSHSESDISRGYDGTWISSRLLNNLPNYANTLS